MPDTPATWEAVSGTPDARLRGGVVSYTGYVERAHVPMRRLEAPFAGVPMIVSFGPSILVDGVRHRSFVAGLGDRASVTEYTGEQRGIQVNFTPLGARRLLGLPMDEIARRVVALGHLRGGDELAERLHDAPGWHARFALLDEIFLRRLAAAPPVDARVQRAWWRLESTGGAVEIGALAREVGWSGRHLAARFRIEVGLGPKAVARILRFERVTRTLRANAGEGLADLAYACGYADQAHLNRDFREFAGTTPTAYAASVLPGGAGVAAGEVANVQDERARAA